MITNDDLKRYDAFLMIVNEGKFDIEGRAVISTALLIKWYMELRPKLLKAVELFDLDSKQGMEKKPPMKKPIKRKAPLKKVPVKVGN
jgi:hypothetical protein